MTFAAVVLLAVACDKDNESTKGDVPAVFTANIGAPAATSAKNLSRVIDATWDNADAIGVFASVASGTLANKEPQNWKYMYAAGQPGAWTSDRPFYFKDVDDTPQEVTFKAYYPWQADVTAESEITLDVTAKQSPADRKTVDFMHADKVSDAPDASPSAGNKTNPKVNFQFRHRMSMVVFTLKPGGSNDGVTAADVAAMTVTLTGLKVKGSFALADGTVTADGVAADLSLTMENANGTMTVTAILPPQTRTTDDDARLLLTNTTASPAETFKTKKLLNFNLEAGKKYTYEITVRKIGLEITSSGITDWVVEDKGNDDAILQ